MPTDMKPTAATLEWNNRYLQRWLKSHIANNCWRVRHRGWTAEDCWQEAWIVFDRVIRRYGDVTIKHAMSLYQTSFSRHIKRVAQARSMDGDVDMQSVSIDEEDGVGEDQLPAAQMNCLQAVMLEAPDDIRQMLEVIIMRADGLSNPAGCSNARRLDRNQQLRAMLRAEFGMRDIENTRPADALRSYLRGDPDYRKAICNVMPKPKRRVSKQ